MVIPKSYTKDKVDNIDMIAKDVRIIDQDGKNTHRGRIEVRNEGILRDHTRKWTR
jgi:hypothetical protein